MASYTVYLRERRPEKDRKNAREALSLLRSAGVHPDIERGPSAVNQAAKLIGRPVHALRLPQIFHGEQHVGGVGPLKKYLAVQGPRERKAVEDFYHGRHIKLLKLGIKLEESLAEVHEEERDHALQSAERSETARSAALRRRDEMKTKLRTEETGSK